MRKSRFKDEQIVAMLRETDRDAVPVVAKRHGVREQTIYTWRKRFGWHCHVGRVHPQTPTASLHGAVAFPMT